MNKHLYVFVCRDCLWVHKDGLIRDINLITNEDWLNKPKYFMVEYSDKSEFCVFCKSSCFGFIKPKKFFLDSKEYQSIQRNMKLTKLGIIDQSKN